MPVQHNALLLRIYISESSRSGRKDAYRALVDAMLAHGLRGAATFRGIAGFGSRRRVSSERAVDALADLPMLIEVVDDPERIGSFIPVLATLLEDGLVTLEQIERVAYRSGAQA